MFAIWVSSSRAIRRRLIHRALCRLAQKFLKTIRTEKMDKEPVCVTALQKCGSTLLCYIVSLVNMDNKITRFRNDFDILPMLSFPTR